MSQELIEKLSTRHPEYMANTEVWEDITLLLRGASAVKEMSRKFIRRRLSESPEEYYDRLSRVTYTPVLPDCIRDLVKSFRTGGLLVDSPGYGPWDTDDFNWMRLCSSIITDSALYGRAVLVLTGEGPKTVSPMQLTNWGDEWAVITDEYYDSDGPLSDYKLVTRYTVIDGTNSRVILVVDGQVVSDTEEPHGLEALPVLLLKAPAELHTGAMALRKAIQHFVVDNVVFEAANNLYIQRYIQRPVVPEDDLHDTYELDSSNDHIVMGSFGFSEAGGSSISAGLEILESIANEIRNIISLGGLSEGGMSNLSGAARRYDYQSYSLTVQGLGAYAKQCLGSIGEWLQQCTAVPGDFEYVGLDIFQVDNLEYMVGVAERLVPLRDDLSNTSLQTWFNRINNLLDRK